MSSWGTTKASFGNGDQKRPDDLIEYHKLPEGEWEEARPIGPVHSYVQFWFTMKIKTKEGKVSVVTIPRLCLDYNPATEEMEDNGCPYRKAFEGGNYSYKVKVGKQDQPVIRMEKKYIGNFILRGLQEDKPRKLREHTRKETKKLTMLGYEGLFKEPGSKSWTPVRAIKAPPTLAVKLRSLTDLNKRKDKKTGKTKVFPLSDVKFGANVNLKFDPKAKGTAMYDAQISERTPITEEEGEYLLQYLDVYKPQELKEAKKDWLDIKAKLVPNPERDNEDNEDDDDTDTDNEDEDDEKPSRKSKSTNKSISKKSKAKPARDSDEEDTDDEDEKPARAKKSVKKTSSKKKAKSDEDDDLEGLEDLEEDEPKKKSSKVKKTRVTNTKKRR